MRHIYKKALFLLIFTLYGHLSNAQLTEKYIKGFIELKSGEKYNGFIKDDEVSQINYKVFFKSSKDLKNPVVYDASTVKSVVLTTGEVYDFLRFKPFYNKDSISVLGKLKLGGKASLYEVHYQSDYILVVVNNGKSYALQDDKLESGELALKKYYFKNLLIMALNDNSLNAEIEKISFGDKNIINILSEYNKKENGENVVIAENKVSSHFIILDMGGMYKNSDENELFIQAMYRIYFPKISNSTSLNIGASAYFTKYSMDFWGEKIPLKRSLFSAPVQLQQNILQKAVRPYLFAGFNISFIHEKTNEGVVISENGFQQNFGLNLLGGVGVEVDLYKNFRLKSEYRYENFSHLITIGVGYYFLKE